MSGTNAFTKRENNVPLFFPKATADFFAQNGHGPP